MSSYHLPVSLVSVSIQCHIKFLISLNNPLMICLIFHFHWCGCQSPHASSHDVMTPPPHLLNSFDVLSWASFLYGFVPMIGMKLYPNNVMTGYRHSFKIPIAWRFCNATISVWFIIHTCYVFSHCWGTYAYPFKISVIFDSDQCRIRSFCHWFLSFPS